MNMLRKGQRQGVEKGNITGQVPFIARLFISNPFKSCVFATWRGQAWPLHFQQESTGFDIRGAA